MERVGDRLGQMERYCSTGQSPQRAVAPTEEDMLNANMISASLVITHMCTDNQRNRINVHWPNGSHCHTQVMGSAFKRKVTLASSSYSGI